MEWYQTEQSIFKIADVESAVVIGKNGYAQLILNLRNSCVDEFCAYSGHIEECEDQLKRLYFELEKSKYYTDENE